MLVLNYSFVLNLWGLLGWALWEEGQTTNVRKWNKWIFVPPALLICFLYGVSIATSCFIFCWCFMDDLKAQVFRYGWKSLDASLASECPWGAIKVLTLCGTTWFLLEQTESLKVTSATQKSAPIYIDAFSFAWSLHRFEFVACQGAYCIGFLSSPTPPLLVKFCLLITCLV